MIYRIMLKLDFDNLDPINDIKDKALDHFAEAKTINQGEPNEEQGFIIVQKCYHEETPVEPCEILEEHYTGE